MREAGWVTGFAGACEGGSEGGRHRICPLVSAGSPVPAKEGVREADTELALYRGRSRPASRGGRVTGMLPSLQRFLFVYIINNALPYRKHPY